jgi:hypothetical protein
VRGAPGDQKHVGCLSFVFFGVVNHQKIGGFFAVKIMGFNNGLTWFSHV